MGLFTRSKPEKKGASASRSANQHTDDDADRGRNTRRADDRRFPSRPPSRSAAIACQSSCRPRREARISISPVRGVYNQSQRDHAYRRASSTRAGRSTADVSRGDSFDRSPHLPDSRVHEVKHRRARSPSWNDDGYEELVVQRMVEARLKRVRKKEKRLW